jgi:hypothetical protein
MVWAVSLSTTKLSPRRLTRPVRPQVFVVWLGAVSMTPPGPSSALPPVVTPSGCPSRHFGENQLSPGSFSISPLSTAHPPDLHLRWVRASTGLYPRFTLAMDSSPGFGSTVCDTSDALFRLAFAVAA